MTSEGKISLLIAEDDPQIRYLFEAAAERSGCFWPVTTAADGQTALDAVRGAAPGHHPEFIVSDLSMPRMTGIDLIRALKTDERTRHIPVAIVTSSNQPTDRDEALAAGAAAFEPKPYGLDALTQLLTTLRTTCVEAAVLH